MATKPAAKKPARKSFDHTETAEVILMEGDNLTDQGSVRLSYSRTDPVDGVRRSSGMTIEISLADGSIVKDRAGARAMVKAEAKKVLAALQRAIK